MRDRGEGILYPLPSINMSKSCIQFPSPILGYGPSFEFRCCKLNIIFAIRNDLNNMCETVTSQPILPHIEQSIFRFNRLDRSINYSFDFVFRGHFAHLSLDTSYIPHSMSGCNNYLSDASTFFPDQHMHSSQFTRHPVIHADACRGAPRPPGRGRGGGSPPRLRKYCRS